jgi:hypothetical protein
MVDVWSVGYLNEIPAGTHVITIEHRPGTDPDSYVLLGPVWLQAGGNIPAHEHPGTADQTLRIGTGAEAGYAGASAVGVNAKALGLNATAYGYDTRSGAGSLALGANSRAEGVDSVSVGYLATTATKTAGVAIGRSATVGDDYSVAIGALATALGKNGVAVGYAATAGPAANSVAIGSDSAAAGLGSVAIGEGASAGHDYSVAIGKDVVTTAAHQARIGDAQTTVVVPGNFRQVGGSSLFGASGSKLGFFGSAGINKPTITGSRGGNQTLAALLTLLASMGLISDGSTT